MWVQLPWKSKPWEEGRSKCCIATKYFGHPLLAHEQIRFDYGIYSNIWCILSDAMTHNAAQLANKIAAQLPKDEKWRRLGRNFSNLRYCSALLFIFTTYVIDYSPCSLALFGLSTLSDFYFVLLLLRKRNCITINI